LLAIAICLISTDVMAQTNNLHYFVKQGDYENVAHYINRHEDVDAFDDNGYTPIMYAADMGRNDLVKLLLDNGAEPNWLPLYDNEPPALHAAVLNEHPETVDLLLQYERTKVDLRDSAGYTALYQAVRWGYVESADVLLFHGADPNIINNGRFTALQVAAAFNDTAMVSLLIEKGAKVDLVADGRTAFSVAMECGAVDVAKMLKDQNCNTTAGYPVHYAARYANAATIDYLKSIGADLNEPGIDSRTPRDLAIICGNTSTARRIAQNGGKCSRALLFNAISLSEFQEFGKHEFRMGLNVGVHEARSNMALYLGASFRPAYRPVLVQMSDNLYYQLREKRKFIHLTLEKRMPLAYGARSSFGPYVAYELACSKGKYDGAVHLDPKSQICHVPCVGLFWRIMNFDMSAGYKYYNYKDALEAPSNVVTLSIGGFFGINKGKYTSFAKQLR